MTQELFAAPSVEALERPDGSVLMRSRVPLEDHPTTVVHSMRSWAERDPGRTLIAERDENGLWRELGYGEVDRSARAVGQALLDMGLGPDRPLMILSGNSVDHLVVLLGAMTAGVPVATTSVAYSLMSRDHERLRAIAGLIRPGAVFAEDGEAFQAAFDAVGSACRRIVAGEGVGGAESTLAELIATRPGDGVNAAFDGLTGEATAKLLFTSGSTGSPKGVITTHRMLASNQQAMRQVWPFLADERPVIVDWLPWSHTFGGSHNLNMILTNGGTLYVDAGRPTPALFGQTLTNIAEVRPTICFSVPAGFAQLVPALEADPHLASAFFARLRLIFNASAALPEQLRKRLKALADENLGHPVSVTGSWGLTETAPAVTSAHFDFSDARSIGVPIPGAELLLAPEGDAFEIRVRGPMVTPGYFGLPELTAEAIDDEGFWRTGDAVQFADSDDPDTGLVFHGRLAEDFKLSTGTFVHVGAVRMSLLSALPVLADAVIAGHDRDEVCALAWLNPTEAAKVVGRAPSATGEVVDDPDLRRHVAEGLATQGARAGSAGRVVRVLLMTTPADLDAGEITDKGYINQRRVLEIRSHLVERLYDPTDSSVVAAAAHPAD